MTRPCVRGLTTTLKRYASGAAFVEKCPAPNCACIDNPQGLDIDRESKLRNTVPFHRRHIVVNTGDAEWPSRFEDDLNTYASKAKTTFGKEGRLFDPRNLPLISAIKYPPASPTNSERLLLFPDFLSVPSSHGMLQDSATQDDVDQVLSALRSRLNWPNDAPNQLDPANLRHSILGSLTPIQKPTILICGHGARDERCGIMGPLLQQQFQATLKTENIDAIVGQITHIGGHKFAGNVILYIPVASAATGNALAGKSIWYGRVNPAHCEGIVKETILGGKVIEELYRGSMAGAEP